MSMGEVDLVGSVIMVLLITVKTVIGYRCLLYTYDAADE